MKKAFKSGGSLWIVVSIICLLSAASLLFFMLQEKTKRIEAEQKLSETERAKKLVEMDLDRTQLELIQLKDAAQLLSRQLEQEKRNYQTAEKELEKKDTQIKDLEKNLVDGKEERTNLANTLAQLREGYNDLQKRLKAAKAKLEEFTGQAGKSADKSGVKLKKIVVKPKKELSGKVLVVNREFHFVVIDLGKKDGVGIGNEFAVYQGQEEIGKVQVEKVYDAMSSASILSGSQEYKITEDSAVKSF